MSDVSQHTTETLAARRRPSTRMMAVVALVLLAGAGGGFYVFKVRGAEAAEPAASAAEPRGAVAFSALTVNLASEPSRHFLRATVQIIVGSPAVAHDLEESAADMARARAAMVDVLSAQTADQLVTAEGKTAVRKILTERLAHDLHDLEVVDVLFSDFVVQY